MQKSDLFNLNYYRQADFTGSKGDVCYRLSLEEGEVTRLRLQWWKGPFSTDRTEEKKEIRYFSYSDEGLERVASFINEMDTQTLNGNMFEEIMRQREKGETS